MSPVLKPWRTSQEGFPRWGVRTKPRLFGHGLSHRSVPSTSKPGHAAHGLQVGASLGSPGKPPLRRVHRPRGADGGGSSGRTRVWRRCASRPLGPTGTSALADPQHRWPVPGTSFRASRSRLLWEDGSLAREPDRRLGAGAGTGAEGRSGPGGPRERGGLSVPPQPPGRADCGRTCWDALAWTSSRRRAGEQRGKPRSGLRGPPRPAPRAPRRRLPRRPEPRRAFLRSPAESAAARDGKDGGAGVLTFLLLQR